MLECPYQNGVKHCECIKNKYNNKSKLLFTNNDSLMYEFITEDVYQDFSINKEMFDFSSNNSTKSKYHDDSKKLVTGKMKGNRNERKVWRLKNV